MALPVAPAFDRVRLIPRPNDFLQRNVGASGELFYDKNNQTLRVYNGKFRGGFELITEDNLPVNAANAEVATVKYVVTVTADQGQNKYVLNGDIAPKVIFVTGYTYLFDQTDPTNEFYPNANGTDANIHPIAFSSDNINGLLGGGTEYTNNVTYKLDGLVVTRDKYISEFARSTERSVQITIKQATPATLYYHCTRHTGMGGEAEKGNPGSGSGAGLTISDTAPENPDPGTLWFRSSTGYLYVYYADDDTSQWIQPVAGNVFSGDYADLANAPDVPADISDLTDTTNVIPSSITDLGIIDGANGQVLTTDGNGGFTFQAGGGSDQSVNTTSDVTFNSVAAGEFIQNSTGAVEFESASTLTLTAPDGVDANGVPLPTNIGVLDMTAATPTWSGTNVATITENDTGDITLGFTNNLSNYAVSASIQTDTVTTAMSVQVIRSASSVQIKVFAADGTTGVDAKVLLVFYEGVE